MTTHTNSDSASLTRRNMLVFGVAAAAVACGADPASGGDASMATDTSTPTDTTPTDTSMATDTSTPTDTSMQTDASTPSDRTSPTDTATPTDATPTDATPTDATPLDAATDTGPADTGAPDVVTDTGPADTGPACPPAGATMLGALSSFPVGSWRNVKAARVIVGRDARGIFAYTSVCTHSGCTVPAPSTSTAGSTCPCHGSRYNAEGMVTGGPAPRSLDNYEVIVCGSDVYLNMSRVVAVGTRTAVP